MQSINGSTHGVTDTVPQPTSPVALAAGNPRGGVNPPGTGWYYQTGHHNASVVLEDLLLELVNHRVFQAVTGAFSAPMDLCTYLGACVFLGHLLM